MEFLECGGITMPSVNSRKKFTRKMNFYIRKFSLSWVLTFFCQIFVWLKWVVSLWPMERYNSEVSWRIKISRQNIKLSETFNFSLSSQKVKFLPYVFHWVKLILCIDPNCLVKYLFWESRVTTKEINKIYQIWFTFSLEVLFSVVYLYIREYDCRSFE